MSKNKTRVTIAGSVYTISSENDEEYIMSVAEEIDSKIQAIKRHNIDTSDLMASILTAMDFCDEYRKAIKEIDNLKNNINENMENLTESQISMERLKKENDQFKEKIEQLEKKLKYKKY